MLKKSIPSREVVSSKYDKIYSIYGELRNSNAFYQWVLNKLNPKPGFHLLDVACGEGHLLRFANEMGLHPIGIDLSYIATKTANRIVGNNIALVSDGEYLPFPNQTFDYVTNLGSLEHFVSPERGLAEMGRRLKPDGWIAIVLPNSYYLLDIIWHVWRRGYPVSHRQIIERFATAGEWRDLIQANSLVVYRTYKYNMRFPRSLEDWRWYWRTPQKMLYFILSPLTPFNLSYSFLYICRRAN